MGIFGVACARRVVDGMIAHALVTMAVIASGWFGGMGGLRMLAADPPACPQATFFSLPTWYKYLPVQYNAVTDRCEVDFSITTNGGVFNGDGIIKVALAVIDILVRAAALIALGFVIVGGFKYMTAQGSPDGTKQALTTIINALIGLVVAFVATAIIYFVGTSIG